MHTNEEKVSGYTTNITDLIMSLAKSPLFFRKNPNTGRCEVDDNALNGFVNKHTIITHSEEKTNLIKTTNSVFHSHNAEIIWALAVQDALFISKNAHSINRWTAF